MAFAEIDMDNGSLWDNVELSDPYRGETREFVRYCLGLTSNSSVHAVKPVNATVRAFETVGIAIREAYNYGQSTPGSLNLPFDKRDFDKLVVDQRKRFMDHMEHFLDMSRREQILQLQGTLPSLEEYWSYRLGTSAVDVTTAVNE